jgi:hypothetical protein
MYIATAIGKTTACNDFFVAPPLCGGIIKECGVELCGTACSSGIHCLPYILLVLKREEDDVRC